MNYRHAYHAGNFADVLKHTIFVRALGHMARKDAPIRIIDTHGGSGLYALSGERAGRTGEWRDGIGKLLAASDETTSAAWLGPYLEQVRSYVAKGRYPGSPLIASAMMRPVDRLVVVERHPEEAHHLRKRLAGRARVEVREGDGYRELVGLMPPVERRALVLVDPPFEDPHEDRAMAEAFAAAHRRFATGAYLFWYPVKGRREADQLARRFVAIGAPKTYRAEMWLHGTARVDRLNGCGLILVNPPWPLADELPAIVTGLTNVLARDGGAHANIEILVAEQ